MSRPNYSYSTASTTRHVAAHGTSSAFSSSANPDEDWTKISDLAERRRIQNRIAQRNYRKKLKRRLEDLERRAGSSSASPPQQHAELQQPSRPKPQQFKRSPNATYRQPSPRILPSQFTPPMDDNDLLFSQGFDRDESKTPPLFAYSAYPAPEEIVYPAYSQSQPYRGIVTTSEYNDYLQPVPVTLPSMMHFHEAIKREDQNTMSPYSMYNQGLPSIDLSHHQPFDDSHPHTPPLIHSYDHSTSSSDSGFYPTTPLSMPPSPPHLPLL